jgi:hypothetical protein
VTVHNFSKSGRGHAFKFRGREGMKKAQGTGWWARYRSPSLRKQPSGNHVVRRNMLPTEHRHRLPDREIQAYNIDIYKTCSVITDFIEDKRAWRIRPVH